MSELEKYLEQFRGDPPTYEQAVLRLNPLVYSPGFNSGWMYLSGELTPGMIVELGIFEKKDEPRG